jgi:hypothetical protein
VTTREWSTVDYYEVLGVAPDASQAEIAARFRELARALHPDARPVDGLADDRFKRVTSAYRVLANPEVRRRYDRTFPRSGVAEVHISPVSDAGRARGPEAPPRWTSRLTRRGARGMVFGGIACFVLGIVATVLVIALQRHDAAVRNDGVATTAVVVQSGGERRLEFTTADGAVVRAPEPLKSGTGRPPIGSQVEIRYDRDDPTTVVNAESQLARDITLWIVAVKLLLVGPILVGYGALRLRRA